MRGYAFDGFVVDCLKRSLSLNGQTVTLTAKSLDLLVLLIEERDRVLSKDEILDRVWSGKVVEENNLFRHVSRVRRALGERPGEHRYVLTVSGGGYRFVGHVEELDDIPPRALPSPAPEIKPEIKVEDDVEPPREDQHPSERPVAKPARRYVAILVAAAACAVIAATMIVLASRNPGKAPAPTVLRQLTYDTGFPREPTWAPNGRSFAYTSDRSGNPDIWVQDVGSQNPVQLTSSGAAESAPAWSPDGSLLAFRSTRGEGGVYVTSLRTRSERRIAPLGDKPRWSPDGTALMFSSVSNGVGVPSFYVVGMDGLPPRLVRPDLVERLGVVAAAWHPDGRISLLGKEAGQPVLVTTGLDDGREVKTLTTADFRERVRELGLELGDFVWSKKGDHLYFEGTSRGLRSLWRVSVDPTHQDVVAGPDRLTAGAGLDANIALAPDGERLMFSIRSARTQLWSYPFSASSGTVSGPGAQLTSGIPGELDAAAVRDGSKFVYRVARGAQNEIWEHSMTTGTDRSVYKDNAGGILTKPRWSESGRTLVFSRRWEAPEGVPMRTELIFLDTDTNNVRTLPVPDQVRLSPTDWPRGDTIVAACQTRAAETAGVCVIQTSDSMTAVQGARPIARDSVRDLWNPRLSPDGRWIVFQALERRAKPTSRLYVMPAAGGPWIAVADWDAFDDKPHWSPDGGTIYFVSNRGGASNVWGRRIDAGTGAPVGKAFRVTSFCSDQEMLSSNIKDMEIAVTPDRLIVPITHSSGQLWMLENLGR